VATLQEQLLRRKPVTAMNQEMGTDDPRKGELARSIGLFQLSLFGIGATIGTGTSSPARPSSSPPSGP
jgi:basic amino acid/polyamine antiporter, APA family